MRYKVVKEYTDNPDKPIKVEEGEVLEFVEESNPDGDWANWVYCRGMDKEGWIPKQILEIKARSVTVQKDYHAVEHRLYPGEVLISKLQLNGWIWAGKLKAPGDLAWAPMNHLELE